MTMTNTILLVEDNPDDLELTILALEKHRIANRVVHLADGADALDYLFAAHAYQGRDITEAPTLILLSLDLPRVSGVEVLTQLRGDARTRGLPVVILTSSDEDRDMIVGHKLGANAFVRKPVDFAQLSDATRQLGLSWIVLSGPPLA